MAYKQPSKLQKKNKKSFILGCHKKMDDTNVFFIFIFMGVCIVQWLILRKYNIHKNYKQIFINDPYRYGF